MLKASRKREKLCVTVFCCRLISHTNNMLKASKKQEKLCVTVL